MPLEDKDLKQMLYAMLKVDHNMNAPLLEILL